MTERGRITLRQGLEDFYKEYAGHLSHTKAQISSEAKAFFRSHDIAHVVFGCDISLFGEGAVKFWTIFGTTLGCWEHIRLYREAEALELSRSFGVPHIVRNLPKLLLAMPILVVRARSMNKPWPWSDFEPFLDMPIPEIRKEFNIRVL